MSFAMKVTNEAQVQRGLQKLRIKYADATHVVAAYRLHNPQGPSRQGFVSDKEYGAGGEVLKVLQEAEVEHTAVFVVCYYGSYHLGKRRFELYNQLAKAAVKALQKKATRQYRLERANSQESIQSIFATVSNFSNLGDRELQEELDNQARGQTTAA